MGRQIPVVIKDDAPSSRLVSAELWKGDVRKRLHAIALWHTGSDADTKDLVADALVRVLEPEDRPWDPNERLFLVHRPPHDSEALHPAEAQTPLSQRGQRRRRRARAHSERRSTRGRRGPSHKDPRSAAGPWRRCIRILRRRRSSSGPALVAAGPASLETCVSLEGQPSAVEHRADALHARRQGRVAERP